MLPFLACASKAVAVLQGTSEHASLLPAADATLKGHLQGRREALVAELHGLLAEQIPHFKPVQLGRQVWLADPYVIEH